MNKAETAKIIENFAPLHLAEPWDCSGWIVETSKSEINKVMLCLTVTNDVIKQAREKNCDMIISHHPLFFVPDNYKNIDIYCAHTNMDRAQGGTTDRLIEVLGLQESGADGFVRYVEQTLTTEKLTSFLNKISDNIRIVNNKNISAINKIAFCAGSGSEFIEEAVKSGSDAFVTGDIKFHTAVESEIVLFDIGHFESEYPVLKVFERLLKDSAEVVFAEEKSPFTTIY